MQDIHYYKFADHGHVYLKKALWKSIGSHLAAPLLLKRS